MGTSRYWVVYRRGTRHRCTRIPSRLMPLVRENASPSWTALKSRVRLPGGIIPCATRAALPMMTASRCHMCIACIFTRESSARPASATTPGSMRIARPAFTARSACPRVLLKRCIRTTPPQSLMSSSSSFTPPFIGGTSENPSAKSRSVDIVGRTTEKVVDNLEEWGPGIRLERNSRHSHQGSPPSSMTMREIPRFRVALIRRGNSGKTDRP